MDRHCSGFTLMELSVVLIIIGLLAGATLVGRELIRIAELQALIRQFGQYTTAVNAFKNKYNCLPGDCAGAVEFGLGTSGGAGDNGNGNGDIDVMDNGPGIDIGRETQNFWYHLAMSGLVPNGAPTVGVIPGVNSPALAKPGMGKGDHPAGGMWIVNEYRNAFINNAGYGIGELPPIKPAWVTITDTHAASVVGPYLVLDVFAVDQKLDDGLPASGEVQMSNGTRSLRCSGNFCYGLNAEGYSNGYQDSCYEDRAERPLYNTKPRYPTSLSVAAFCIVIMHAQF